MFGSAAKTAPQPRLEPVHRFPGRGSLDLRADKPTFHLEIGLRENRALHRGIATLCEFHPREAHLSVGEPSDRADLRAGIVGRTWQLAARCDADVDDG
jgi:hypothetical protein